MCNNTNKSNERLYEKQETLKNGKTLTIRMPKKEDALSLVEHMKTVDQETSFLGREPGEFSFTVAQEEKFISSLSDNKQMCFLIGEVDQEVIANVSVGIVRNNKRFLHRASMGITVQKKMWGNGIGKHLMEKAIEWCQMNRIEQLELEVVSTNTRAIALYQQYGFEIQGTIPHALKYQDGSYADEYMMVFKVKSDE